MISRDEAFLILKKWWDDKALLEWSEVTFSTNRQGETISIARGFWQVRVREVSSGSVTFRFDRSPEMRRLEVPEGTKFEYSDCREPRFLDLPVDDFACCLEVERPDGLRMIFGEKSER